MTQMTSDFIDLIVRAALAISAAGSVYALVAALLLRRFSARPEAPAVAPCGVTVLKPLHGAEAGLYDNLASFCRQHYAGPVQIVFGVKDAHDPAVKIVRRLIADFPRVDIELAVDATGHGANGKISNLINMTPLIRHEVLVLADSDIRVEADYLTRLVAELSQPGVGLVTCLYRGVPAGGFWSRLDAQAINHHFLPSVLVGLAIGRADPCFGATIALRREMLTRIGGFEAFANQLADDHAIGVAVRRTGERIAIPHMMVSHTCRARGPAELLRQELRWALTLRLLDPAGFFGTAITHPLPFCLLALALAPHNLWTTGFLLLVLLSRLRLQVQVDSEIGAPRPSWQLGPLRDILSFAVFVASHFTDAVMWRGQRFRVRRDGTLIPSEDLAS
jgi:ceramide glucosyltransferase